MHSRFFAPALDPASPAVVLPADEANHLARVMRIRAGEVVRVFDGRGVECEGVVQAINRDKVEVRIGVQVTPAAEASVRLTLGQAVLKGDSMDGVIRDAVMLGVAAVAPILTARIEADRRASAAGARLERWARVAVSSAKQCGRAVVPPIHSPVPLPAWLAQPPAEVRLALVEPTADWPPVSLAEIRQRGIPRSAEVLVGPEGGWTPEELTGMRAAGVVPITLGSRTLRAESAALIGLAALYCAWGEFV